MPTNPELEAVIDENPENEAARLVYADWLQEHGDPHGELCVVQAALAKKRTDRALAIREQNLLIEHAETFLPGLQKFRSSVDFRITWRFGFIDTLTVNEVGWATSSVEGDRFLRHVLALPSSRFVRELALKPVPIDGSAFRQTARSTIATLIEVGLPPTLRSLAIADVYGPVHDLDPLWPKIARLERFVLQARDVKLETIHLPKLRTLDLELPISSEHLAAMRDAEWPSLSHLTLGLARATCTSKELGRMLDALPPIQHLGLVRGQTQDTLVEALLASKVIAHVKTLDLSQGNMTVVGARRLAAAKLAHLTSIDVSFNRIRMAGVDALKDVYGRRVNTAKQQR